MSFQLPNLPYEFDLLYDIKTLEQVEWVMEGTGGWTDATPHDLYELFLEYPSLDMPKSLLAWKDELINFPLECPKCKGTGVLR